MTIKNKWVDVSILNLCIVACLGLLMRSKIVLALPAVNYNHLLEAHSHFAFVGWVSLILMVLMVRELLPGSSAGRPVYSWLFGGTAIIAWSMLIAFYFGGYNTLSMILSGIFILLSYFFSLIFIRDALKANLEKPVLLLAVSSLVCLVLSSAGSVTIACIFFSRSVDAFLYRNALFTYLHFQYNGFFSLSIFALLFHQIGGNRPWPSQKHLYRFAVAICVSIIPSLFLSYLWQDPAPFLRAVAMLGSVLVLLSLFLFLFCVRSIRSAWLGESPAIRFLVFLSISAFILKVFLQSLTIFPQIGNTIFGNRPVIMGFLHLVFLGFVTLFILAVFARRRFLDDTGKFTSVALLIFALAVLLNEALLITQGLATMFIRGSGALFSWLLWVAAVCLLAGALLIAIARFGARRLS